MPYEKIEDLPDRVRNHLPKHAQRIYKSAFNSAYVHYKSETTAAKVAWGAVKRMYEKCDDGVWRRKEAA